ncbi:hypothetical protein [Chitinophaga sp. YIM B06452]|uniref:hypothetical protein n=1 Tax=Chitinophaga sp. YIM B06452 TaxID=3082158 RepID=UPI0031FF2B96
MFSSKLTLYVILVWLTSLSLPPLIILILLQLNEQSVYASWNFSFVYILALLVSVLYGLPGLLLFAWMGYRAFKKETSLKIKRIAMVKAVGLSVVLTFLVFPLVDPANIFEEFGWGRLFIVLVYLTTAIAAAWFYPLEDRPEIKNLPQ